MVSSVNPPPLQVPAVFLKDKLSATFFSGLIQTIYQLWTQTYSIRLKTKVLTTDATITSIIRVPVPSGKTVMITAEIVARRTGGTAGANGDSAWYRLSGAYKNIGGVLTGIGTPSLFGGEDQAAWNVGFSSNAQDALVTVVGAANNNITWEATVSTYEVGA
jgi:hypothetical protein